MLKIVETDFGVSHKRERRECLHVIKNYCCNVRRLWNRNFGSFDRHYKYVKSLTGRLRSSTCCLISSEFLKYQNFDLTTLCHGFSFSSRETLTRKFFNKFSVHNCFDNFNENLTFCNSIKTNAKLTKVLLSSAEEMLTENGVEIYFFGFSQPHCQSDCEGSYRAEELCGETRCKLVAKHKQA